MIQSEAHRAEARATARPRLFEVGGSPRARGQSHHQTKNLSSQEVKLYQAKSLEKQILNHHLAPTAPQETQRSRLSHLRTLGPLMTYSWARDAHNP
jgi:hypothetical protein